MLDKLIGAQVFKIDGSIITVKIDDEIYNLEIETDDGDCCGYAEFETNLFYSERNNRNPIITKIEKMDCSEGCKESTIVTFYGESKKIFDIKSEAGSGSGWYYGAYVKLRCKALDINETLASW